MSPATDRPAPGLRGHQPKVQVIKSPMMPVLNPQEVQVSYQTQTNIQ